MWKRHKITVCYAQTLYIYDILTLFSYPMFFALAKHLSKSLKYSLVVFFSLLWFIVTLITNCGSHFTYRRWFTEHALFFWKFTIFKGTAMSYDNSYLLNNNNVLSILLIITHLINQIRLLHRDNSFLCLHIRKLGHRR